MDRRRRPDSVPYTWSAGDHRRLCGLRTAYYDNIESSIRRGVSYSSREKITADFAWIPRTTRCLHVRLLRYYLMLYNVLTFAPCIYYNICRMGASEGVPSHPPPTYLIPCRAPCTVSVIYRHDRSRPVPILLYYVLYEENAIK